MDTLLNMAVGVVGIAVGALGGFGTGRAARARGSWLTWVAAAAVLIVGIGFASYGQIARMPLVWSWAMGLIAGGLTGLKYGRGGLLGRDRMDSAAEPQPTRPRPPRDEPPEPEAVPDAEPHITRH